METTFKLQDRTALLVGPYTSYNHAIANKLTQLGCSVALVDRNIEKIQRVAESLMDAREINEKYGRAVAVQADISKSHHVQDAVTRAAESFGGIDIFIDGLMITDVKPFKEANSIEDIDRLIDVNLRSPILLTHGVLRFLESRKRGRVIYLMHDMIRLGLPGNGLLAATRGGLTEFVKTMAREMSEAQVTFNCVSLGPCEEFVMTQVPESGSAQAAQKNLQAQYPHLQIADPEKMANVVAFLASPLGAAINGQTISASQGLIL